MNRFNKATLLAGTIMAGAMIAAPVQAQDVGSSTPLQSGADEDADFDSAIVVTGSRIARRNVDTAAPVAVVDAEEFRLAGAVNVEAVINTLPQVVPGTTAFSNNPGNGASTLNLRGLGTTRTLVLVNGRRWLSFDTTQVVDLNTIPQFLLESVDTVTGGASAVYGSDALAGVVNFNLRDIEGVELGGLYSLTERGDGSRYQVYGAIGTSFDDGRGSATVFAEYFNREEIFQGDRAFSNFAIGGETFGVDRQVFGSSSVPQGRLNAPGNVTINAAGDTLSLAEGLTIDDAIFNQDGSARARAGDTYNYAPENYLQIPQERYLIGGFADYEFTDGHSAYTEVTFVNNRVATELAPTPVTGNFLLDIDTVSQFLDDDVIEQLQILDERETAASAARVANGLSPLEAAEEGVVRTFFQRRVQETGPRNSLDERNAFRVLAGVTGGITDDLSYDAYYSYARTRNANVQQGNISRSAFQAGFDGTGTPINPFGLNNLTPDQVAAITIQAQNGDISTVEVAAATISGFFGELGLGGRDVGFVIGGEYRKVGAEFLPDTALSSGDVIGFNAGEATAGSYDVREIFGEIDIPVFETDAGTRLDLNAAGRYSDYSLDAVGGVFTYAGGVEFAPVQGILLRGQYQRAVRAPNVGELFGGQAIGFPGASDPCGDPVFLADNPGARETCIATGVPAGNVGNAAVVQLDAQIPALFGGNPNLGEETSTSYTAGVVLQPSFFPRLTITADYFNIEIEEVITIAGGGLQGLLNLCYGTAQDVNSPLCQPFVGIRNNDGAIDVNNPPAVGGVNAAELTVSGIDLQVNFNTPLGFSFMGGSDSQLDLNFLGTWTDQNDFVPIAELDDVVECAGRFGGACSQPIPEYKWVSRASIIDGPVTASVRWQHLSGVDDQDDATNFADFGGVEQIDSYDLFDFTIGFNATENLQLSFGVNNIFDTLPDAPTFDEDGIVNNDTNSLLLGDNQEQANTFPSVYNVLGRDFFVSAAFTF